MDENNNSSNIFLKLLAEFNSLKRRNLGVRFFKVIDNNLKQKIAVAINS